MPEKLQPVPERIIDVKATEFTQVGVRPCLVSGFRQTITKFLEVVNHEARVRFRGRDEWIGDAEMHLG